MLAVSHAVRKLPAQVTIRTLAEQRLWLLSAVDDPLAGSDRARSGTALELDELRGRAVVMPERGTALRELLLGAFTEAGFSPLPLFETSDPQTLRQLVAAGLGLSVVPDGWLGGDGPPVAALPLQLPTYRIAMLATTQPRVPARDLLADHLARALTSEE